MHHISYGIVARVMSVFKQFLEDKVRKNPFKTLVNPHLLEMTSLWLDWLHIRQLPKNMWLAVDELGLSRIMSFAYI